MTVVTLRLRENARHDTWRLLGAAPEDREHTRRLGSELDRLMDGLSRVSLAWHDQDHNTLRQAGSVVADEAGAFGLNRIARVARTVSVLAHEDEVAALAANVARLLRLGQALFEDVWELQHRPG